MKVPNLIHKSDPAKTKTSLDPARPASQTRPNAVHDLQQTVGNRVLSRLLQPQTQPVDQAAPVKIQRKCSECEEEEKQEA